MTALLSKSLSPKEPFKFKAARIFIVDDEPSNVLLLQRILKGFGYSEITCITDSRQVKALCESQWPDLLLLDLMMPFVSGFEVMEQLQGLGGNEYLPILMLTADITPSVRERALSGGAKDFLTKPFDRLEVVQRVNNLLETRFLYLHQRDQNRLLEERVHERTRDLEQSKLELEESQTEILSRLAQAAELRDDDTGQHTRRVGEMAELLARELGLNEERACLIRLAAPLHDVGKIGIPDTILLKPGKLTGEEFDIMKTHASIGGSVLKDGHSPLVQVAEIIARSHHEKWDGSGYPDKLKGLDIPIEGRILAVVDVFDALTHERPYKKAWPLEEALKEIERGAGHHFDPRVVEAFLALARRQMQSPSALTRSTEIV